ncbi:MAG TPA: 30S ribosomal protein S13 [Acidobacteriota bacterium]
MPRIAGVDVPREKRIDIALTYIFGIGRITARRLCDATKIDGAIRAKDLTEEQVSRIRQEIDRALGGRIEGELRKEVSLNVKRLIEIGSYRGYRHRKSLPCRGQRTHTNARTLKGPRPSKALSRARTRRPSAGPPAAGAA